MLDLDAARKVALTAVSPGLMLGQARELREGWFFAFRVTGEEPVAGSQGVIVNKHDGRIFRLGSAFSLARDQKLYDKGYQFERYDLSIIEVVDAKRTLDVLVEVGICIVEPQEEHGTVWRIPRALTRRELRDRIAVLPGVFEDINLYFRIEHLENARRNNWFRFEVLEHRSPGPT
jgi:hypothetical protein